MITDSVNPAPPRLRRRVPPARVRWVSLLEETQKSRVPDAATQLDPRDFATRVVAPHWPRWIEIDARRGVLTVEDAGKGTGRMLLDGRVHMWFVEHWCPKCEEIFTESSPFMRELMAKLLRSIGR